MKYKFFNREAPSDRYFRRQRGERRVPRQEVVQPPPEIDHVYLELSPGESAYVKAGGVGYRIGFDRSGKPALMTVNEPEPLTHFHCRCSR